MYWHPWDVSPSPVYPEDDNVPDSSPILFLILVSVISQHFFLSALYLSGSCSRNKREPKCTIVHVKPLKINTRGNHTNLIHCKTIFKYCEWRAHAKIWSRITRRSCCHCADQAAHHYCQYVTVLLVGEERGGHILDTIWSANGGDRRTKKIFGHLTNGTKSVPNKLNGPRQTEPYINLNADWG